MHMSITQMGGIVRSAREAKNLTQAALAEKIEVSTRTIIAVENNQRNPTYEVFYRLVHALDISADLILYPDSVPYTPEQDQFIRELLACDEREMQIVFPTLQSLLRALREDVSEKQP